MIGYARITRAQFYELGSFRNSRLVRTQRGRSWAYFLSLDFYD